MIRQFRREDAQFCCRLVHSCLQQDTSLSAALREKILNGETPLAMEERSRLFYLAVYEAEGQILGIAGLDMNEIRLLFVAPGHQRRGIGRALLEHISAMVPAYLFQDIFVYSAIPAVSFYSAHGFIEKGQVSFELGGESMPAVFMTLQIPR
jgi:GNAT superfamily N-acetyltransferase